MTYPTHQQQHQVPQLIFTVATVMLQIHLTRMALLLTTGLFVKIGLADYQAL